MESALDVLSRAAIMVQDNANESRLSSKELPTTAWRRERRSQAGEYNHPHHYPAGFFANTARASSPSLSSPKNAHVQHSSNSSGSVFNTRISMPSNGNQVKIVMSAAVSERLLNESTNHPLAATPHDFVDQMHLNQLPHSEILEHINSIQNDDAPLDMSVGNLKQLNSRPPPYREPLPGSQFVSTLARPSVITQAPPKRDKQDSPLVASRENGNRSCESIDEHFRRSLGNDYFSLFSKKSPVSQSAITPSPQPHNPQISSIHIKSPSPILALSSTVSTLPPQSTIPESEPIPPPAYTSGHRQQNSQAHQNQILAIPKANNALLSPATIAAQIKIAGANSPPLPLVVRSNVLQNQQNKVDLQKSSSLINSATLISSKSSTPGVKLDNITQAPMFNMSGTKTDAPLPLQQQSSSAVVCLSHLAPIDNSPSSSPRNTPPTIIVPVSIPSPNLPAILRIKTEPGLQIAKSTNPTPPASPTPITNQNVTSNSNSNSGNTSSPSSPKTSSWKHFTNTNNSSAEVLASVDDHFAKALGDTWKKLQENKEILK